MRALYGAVLEPPEMGAPLHQETLRGPFGDNFILPAILQSQQSKHYLILITNRTAVS